MTDTALNESPPTLAAAMASRVRENQQRPVDRVVSLAHRSADEQPAAAEQRANAPRPADFTSAIELIHEASEAIRISEERAEELEAEIKRVMEQASDEVRRLNYEIAARDAQLLKTEDQLRASEARADEADMWLARLHEAVVTSFEPLQRGRSSMSSPAPSLESPGG